MIYNRDQSITIAEGKNWYHNGYETLFQIDGEAGTGKSVVINEIAKSTGLQPEEILPMAYTGQAAIVMRKKGLTNAVTCHSGLFDFCLEPVIDKLTGMPYINKKFNLPIMRSSYIPKDLSASGIKLLIIDEARMVPFSFRRHIENTGIKTLVCGDAGQLPPIKDKPAYLIDGKIHHLTELMRQTEYSPIVYLARRARRGLPIECGMYGNQVFVVYEDEIDNRILDGADVVICGKNNTREDINTTIRKEFKHTDADVPIFGERVICKKNNWQITNSGIALANGLVGTVIRPPKVSNYDGKCFTMDFLPDLLDTPFINISCDYSYINAPFVEKQEIRESKYSVGEKFDYAYALTTHSAQGSEYSNGIYIEENMMGNIQNNLNYTAITRFKDRLIYVKKKQNRYYYFR